MGFIYNVSKKIFPSKKIILGNKIVLEAGLEPARPQWSLDFKSNVSTNSTTRALERKTGFEPATLTLAR